MNNLRNSLLLSAMTILGVALQAGGNTIPTVTINDTAGPIVVTGTGFSSDGGTFQTGLINNNPEAIWWVGTVNPFIASLGLGSSKGIWTDPGSTKISDEYFVISLGMIAGGIFLSDPSTLPTSVTLPGLGTFDFSKYSTTSVESGLPTQISPSPDHLAVYASSSVPDGGSTIILLGLGLLGMGGCVRFFRFRPCTA